MLVLEPANRLEVRTRQRDVEFVVAIERKRRLREDAALGSNRKAFDMGVLRGVLTDAERYCVAFFGTLRTTPFSNGEGVP